MRLETSQRLRLEQRMKLAPRMIQSMEILQLPLLALQERIEQELISNPVLEMSEVDPDQPGATDGESAEDVAAQVEARQKDLVVAGDGNKTADFERLAEITDDSDFDDYYAGNRGGTARAAHSDDRDAKLDAMANTAARGVSLHEYLTFQWALVDGDEGVKRAGQTIINHLEDDGYLRVELEDLAHRGREPSTVDDLQRGLLLVQALDPPGVGARDIQECLLLQMDAVTDPLPVHDLARRLAEDHLRELEANRLPRGRQGRESFHRRGPGGDALPAPLRPASRPADRAGEGPLRRPGRHRRLRPGGRRLRRPSGWRQ